MEYSRKNQSRGLWGYTFLKKKKKKDPGISRFIILPVEIPDKMKFCPWNLKLSYNTLIEIPRPKTKTHGGNSTWFFLMTPPCKFHPFFTEPWNFHSFFFFNTPGNSMSSFTCLDYFWNNPLALSWQRLISYRNQSINLLCKLMDWFLYDDILHHERVN